MKLQPEDTMKPMKHTIYAWGLLTLLTLGMATAARATDATGANATADAAAVPVLVMASNAVWPDTVLPEVNYENMPLSGVVDSLQDSFKGGFDMILPSHVQVSGADMIPTNLLATPISLKLKNADAQEIFTAMNMYFDVNNVSLRWEMSANGSRPVAVLRLQEGAVTATSAPKRMVFFVGDLLGDGKNGGMTMDDVVRTVSEVYLTSFNQPADKVIQAHKEGQLIVVTGTDAEIGFVNQTLQALKQKVELQRAKYVPTAFPVVGAPPMPAGSAPAVAPAAGESAKSP